MSTERLTLHVDANWASPYALCAFVALREKGLPFDTVPLLLSGGDHRTGDYPSASLTGRVPALRHGDWWLSESSAIAEYLAETFPFPRYPRLFPEDLRERGRCRQLQAWVRSDLMPLREERTTHTVFFPSQRATKPLSDKGQQAASALIRVADALVAEGRTTLFAQWCIADVDLGMMLQRLHANGDALPRKLAAYAEAQWARPSVKEWVDKPRPPAPR